MSKNYHQYVNSFIKKQSSAILQRSLSADLLSRVDNLKLVEEDIFEILSEYQMFEESSEFKESDFYKNEVKNLREKYVNAQQRYFKIYSNISLIYSSPIMLN